MDWNLNDSAPIWQQLTDGLTLEILKGVYPPGSKLPTVRDLAARAGVNPNTMQRAMAQLEQRGLAVGGRTAGRTVTEDAEVIRRAKEAWARTAVAACLKSLEALGYTREDAVVFLREGNDHA